MGPWPWFTVMGMWERKDFFANYLPVTNGFRWILAWSGMGMFWRLPEFRLFHGPQSHSQNSSKFGEKIFVYIYLKPRVADTMCSGHDHVHPHSELAWRHTIHAFHGGLQARLRQVKIGLQSFVTQFSQAIHEKTRLLLWEVYHPVLGLWVCRKQVQWK